jgi:predicted kinase
MAETAKLIVLRGPSGAGKSTVAARLHQEVAAKTALIEQDYYRYTMFNNLHSDLEAPRYVMFAGVLAALGHGYDVILEGFMGMGKYKPYFDDVLERHPEENYFFYFDVPFQETLRRHTSRQKDQSLDEAKMHELYLKSGPTSYPKETVIHQDTSVETAVSRIAGIANLQLNPHTASGASSLSQGR